MIECEGLTKRFGGLTAVDHVSLSVGKGSIFGFLGPNGSGKSTVIRMLCGILEPTEGTARIGGHDIIREGEPIKEMIGYMSQQFSLYDELTVNENLLFAGKLYGLRDKELKKRRDELIETTHLKRDIGKRENQMQALQMSMVFLLPSVFFSGFIFPRETMPWIFYALGALFPTTYFIALMRAIILRGAHFLEYWPNLAVLIGMSISLFVLCALRFRKKIA